MITNKEFGEAILRGLPFIDEYQTAFLYQRSSPGIGKKKNCGCAVGAGIVGLIGDADEAVRRYLFLERGTAPSSIAAAMELSGLDYDTADAISNAHCHGVKAKVIANRLINGERIFTEDEVESDE